MDGNPAQPPRCQEHGLAVGPDGRCVLCRRAERQATPRRGGGLLLLLLTAGLAGGGYYLYQRQGGTERPAATRPPRPDAAPRMVRVAHRPPPRRPVAPPRRPVAPPSPRPSLVHPAPRQARVEPDAGDADERERMAARRRMDRLYEQAVRGQAMERVSITMYMADW